RLCQAVAGDATVTEPSGVDQRCEALFLSHGALERDYNLLFVREQMLKSETDAASVLDLYARIRRGQRVRDDSTDPVIGTLHLAGIIRVDRHRPFTLSPFHPFLPSSPRLRVRNRIYAH